MNARRNSLFLAIVGRLLIPSVLIALTSCSLPIGAASSATPTATCPFNPTASKGVLGPTCADVETPAQAATDPRFDAKQVIGLNTNATATIPSPINPTKPIPYVRVQDPPSGEANHPQYPNNVNFFAFTLNRGDEVVCPLGNLQGQMVFGIPQNTPDQYFPVWINLTAPVNDQRPGVKTATTAAVRILLPFTDLGPESPKNQKLVPGQDIAFSPMVASLTPKHQDIPFTNAAPNPLFMLSDAFDCHPGDVLYTSLKDGLPVEMEIPPGVVETYLFNNFSFPVLIYFEFRLATDSNGKLLTVSTAA